MEGLRNSRCRTRQSSMGSLDATLAWAVATSCSASLPSTGDFLMIYIQDACRYWESGVTTCVVGCFTGAARRRKCRRISNIFPTSLTRFCCIGIGHHKSGLPSRSGIGSSSNLIFHSRKNIDDPRMVDNATTTVQTKKPHDSLHNQATNGTLQLLMISQKI